jgi:Copper type II ascorbate-dependent monooxygenase, C-terminal domain
MRLSLLLAFALLMAACSKQVVDDAVVPPTANTTFGLIQQRILNTSCATAGCHASEADASFKQHGLVLAAGVAYKNLVGIDPKNTLSLTDGHKRVKAFESAKSLFYHKLNVDVSHHSGKSYGNPMPLGSDPLTVGQIEFVRRWIDAGALPDGNLIDPTLLDDKTPSTANNGNWTAPAPPTAGQGYQLKIDAFDITPNFERELFVRRTVGNPDDIYVSRFTVNMRPGSHHFIAYDFSDKTALPMLNQVRDLRNADNTLNLLTALQMRNQVYLAGAQSPTAEYAFPAGYALLVPANATLDLNTHYVNRTKSVMKGEAYINFYTVPKANVTRVVKALNLGNTSLTTQPGERKTFTKTFTFSKPTQVLAVTSHMHKIGEKFVVKISGGARNGEVVYTTTDWEHPEMTTFAKPISFAKGEGLTSEITYFNNTAKTVSFGLTSDDEMGIIFGYYYEEN